VHQLTSNSYWDGYPQIDRGQVVWYGHDGSDYEIFLWDGSVHQLTSNSYWDGYPQIDLAQVVWYGYDGSDYEVFLCVGSPLKQIEYIENFFGTAQYIGELLGTKPGTAGDQLLYQLYSRIETVNYLIAQGKIDRACRVLRFICDRIDGDPSTPDWATGPAATEMVVLIQRLQDTLGCE